MRQWISPIPEICRGVDVADLRMNAQLVYDALVALGPDGIAQFDKKLYDRSNLQLKGNHNNMSKITFD